MSGGEPGRRATRRTQHFVIPDHLPGETEYGAFIDHMTRCPDCGYGHAQCEQATSLWQAYKDAKRPPTQHT